MKKSSSLIYLDNNATLFTFQEVVEKTTQIKFSKCGNHSSLHSSGASAHNLLAISNFEVGSLVVVSEEQIIFNSVGTDSLYLAFNNIQSHRNSPSLNKFISPFISTVASELKPKSVDKEIFRQNINFESRPEIWYATLIK